MADRHFEVDRLARVYDALDPDRSDLDAYDALLRGLGARRVLDLGCGTGTLAVRLAGRGLDVTGLDPAAASLRVAREKPGAERVRWVEGTAPDLAGAEADAGGASYDVVTVTGNAAQAVVDDAEWADTLVACRRVLRPGGHLVLETRVPGARAWEGWTPAATRVRADLGTAGSGTSRGGSRGEPWGESWVESWVEVTEVALPLVRFRTTFRFGVDGAVLTSDSTLRFRGRDELVDDLARAGLETLEVRDAPDRPGRELVVVARRPSGTGGTVGG